jgi:hypothetical protein
MSLPISASQVARITGVSCLCPVQFYQWPGLGWGYGPSETYEKNLNFFFFLGKSLGLPWET